MHGSSDLTISTAATDPRCWICIWFLHADLHRQHLGGCQPIPAVWHLWSGYGETVWRTKNRKSASVSKLQRWALSIFITHDVLFHCFHYAYGVCTMLLTWLSLSLLYVGYKERHYPKLSNSLKLFYVFSTYSLFDGVSKQIELDSCIRFCGLKHVSFIWYCCNVHQICADMWMTRFSNNVWITLTLYSLLNVLI